MNRFYKEVTIDEGKEGFLINLDGKPIKTPNKKTLVIPYYNLAKEVANEWAKQGNVISFDEMSMTKFVYTVLDQLHVNQNENDNIILDNYIVGKNNWQERAIGYLQSDCLLYIESEPKELKLLQEDKWFLLINKFNKKFGTSLKFIDNFSVSISHDDIDKVMGYLSILNEWQLFTFVIYASELDSFLLAYFIYSNKISDEYALELSYLHENFQNSIWGVDEISLKDKQKVLQTIKNVTRFKNFII